VCEVLKIIKSICYNNSSNNRNNSRNSNSNNKTTQVQHTDRCGNNNGQKCHANGSRKYNSLCIEMKQMWNMKCMITPVVIGATRIVTEGLKKNLEDIPGERSIDSLQKAAILATSHIIQKVLQSET
jgi:3-deoxy-D-manno-octulosonic acid (KDO) 8-phosphate synthase